MVRNFEGYTTAETNMPHVHVHVGLRLPLCTVYMYVMHTLAHLSCMISLGTVLVAVGDLAVMKITYLESKT